MSNVNPRIPNVGEFVRTVGRLIDVKEVTPPPPPPPPSEKQYVFEQICARGEVRLNGEVLKNFGTYTDYYGLETSVEKVTEQMRAYAAANGIGPSSELEVVVVRIVSYDLRRVGKEAGFYDKTYVEFKEIPYSQRMVACCPAVERVWWSSREVAGPSTGLRDCVSLALADVGEDKQEA